MAKTLIVIKFIFCIAIIMLCLGNSVKQIFIEWLISKSIFLFDIFYKPIKVDSISSIIFLSTLNYSNTHNMWLLNPSLFNSSLLLTS